MVNFKALDHPMVSHYLTILRNKETGKDAFKSAIDKISYLLAAQVYSNLELKDKVISTPLKRFKGSCVKNPVVIMPILRAGLGFMQGFTDLYPAAMVSHIGIYRNEHTLEPVNYYFKFPEAADKKKVNVIILEPMVATGGSAIYAASVLLSLGIKNIHIASLIAAPEGIKAFKKAFNKEKPLINITACALDNHLNNKGYIVPGLGDAGDRMFGT
jgi:uracil phosphoribosyltransferase